MLVVTSISISSFQSHIKVLVPEEKGDSPLLISLMRYKVIIPSFSLIFLSKAPVSPFCYRLCQELMFTWCMQCCSKSLIVIAFRDTVPFPV